MNGPRILTVVIVLAVQQDDYVASAIVERLARQGIASRRQIVDGVIVSAVVAVMSQNSLVDGEWLAQLMRLRGRRAVPVAVGDISELPKPEHLAAVNWIFWDSTDEDSVADRIFIGLSTDVVAHGTQRSLEMEATSWRASGFRDDALIFDVKRAKEAQVLVQYRSANEGSGELLERFTTASVKYAKRRRRGRIYRRIYAVGIFLLVLVFPLATLLGQRDEFRASQTSAKGLDMSVLETRPDVAALLSIGAAGSDPFDAYNRQVIKALDRDWGRGRVAWAGERINYVSIIGDSGAITADAAGGLARWNLDEARVEERKKVADVSLEAVWSDAVGLQIVGVSKTQAYLVSLPSWDISRVALSQPPIDGLVSAGGGLAALVLSDGQVIRIGTANASSSVVGRYDHVLDVALAGADELELLVRQGDQIQVVDIRTGTVKAHTTVTRHDLESGALNVTAARVAIVSNDRELFMSGLDLALQGTGQRTDEIVRDIAVSDSGLVLVAGELSGVTVYSPEAHSVVAELCQGDGLVHGIHLLGTRGVCDPEFLLFDLGALGPTGPPSFEANVKLSNSPTFTSEDELATMTYLEDDNEIQFVNKAATDPVQQGMRVPLPELLPASTRVAVLALSPRDAILLGTDRGDVLEVALNRRAKSGDEVFVVVGEWRNPDGSAIKALGYTEDGMYYYIQTAAGNWFTRVSCTSCFLPDSQVDLIRAKRHNMYSSAILDALPADAAQRFDLRTIPSMPDAGIP